MDCSFAKTQPSRPFRVAIYMHDLAGGGVERQSILLASGLRGRGVHVTLVLHRLEGQLAEQLPDGIKVHQLGGKRTLTDIPKLMRYLSSEQPDVLLANLDHNNVAALLAKSLSRTRTRIVICQHNPIGAEFAASEGWSYHLIPKLYQLLSGRISKAIAVSSGLSRELISMAGIPPEKVVVIHNPVLDAGFLDRSYHDLEHPWLIDRQTPVFVTAGRLVAQKDHETLLRALALHRRRFDSRLIVLGTGGLLTRLDALASGLGIHDAVDFVGFLSNPLPLLRAADAFVLSSRSEGFGNVLVEAMGCGTPVISTNCRHGPSEILANGKYGLLVPIQDPEALAAAMDQVGDLRARFPAEVLEARSREFSESVCTDRYFEVIRSMTVDPIPA